MPSIEEKVNTVLTGAAGVVALCPADRIKPEGVYQKLERPYIRHFVVTVELIHTHQGTATLKNWPYQISMFCASIEQLVSLRTAVMAALEASTDPKFLIRGMPRIETPMDSTDSPVIGQAILCDAWYE